MIIGLGIDLVELSRITKSLQRFGDRFYRKLLHPEELQAMSNLDILPAQRMAEWVGGRFAAKEAAFKALGTGMANGIGLHDIRIRPDTAGKPCVYFYGNAQKRCGILEARKAHLSLTHTASTAAAVVILSR